MKNAYAVIAMAIAIIVGTCDPVSLRGQEVAVQSKVVRIEGNEIGVPWLEVVKALRPAMDLSSVRLSTVDWVIPWRTFQRAATDKTGSYRDAMKIIVDSSGKPRALDIDITKLSNDSTQWKQEFAEWRATDGDKPAYRIEPVSKLNGDSTKDRRRVLVIGGYQSQAGEALSVAQYIHDQSSIHCEVFSYPTDGAIDLSAKRLAELLSERHRESPQLEWSIVGHSMGGIIGRAALEIHEAKGIKRLIQVFPPNHGSVLAEIAEPLDGVMIAKSQLMRIFSSLDGGTNDSVGKAIAPAAVLTWMGQGFGLASRDLCPESPFLEQLNSCKRISSVDYSVLIGTGAPLRPLVGASILLSGPALAEQLAKQKEIEEVRKAWNWIERLVRDGQLIQGQGDGVVSVSSAKLNGVSDTVMIPCNHIAWSALQKETGQRVMEEVLKRIKADR